MIHKIVTGVLAVLTLLLGGTQLFGAPSANGPAHYSFESFLQGLAIGPDRTATKLTAVRSGTCNMIAPSFTFAASSSQPFDCAIPGVKSGDVVWLGFATSSANGAGWLVTQASASTTAGYVTGRLVNNTGTSAVIPASLASSTKYTVFSTQRQ